MWRLSLVFTFIIILYLGIIARLFYLQVVSAADLKTLAQNQHTKYVRMQPDRGLIVASDGSPLVTNQPSYTVFAEPNHIESLTTFAELVGNRVGVPKEKIYENISVEGRKWAPIAKNVTPEKKEELEKLNLKGLGFDETSTRYYPESSMAGQLLGFVASDSDGNQKGYFGLEGYYDMELAGKEGSVIGERDGKGAPILIGDQTRIQTENGRTLVLWLDRSIQYIVEKRLKEGINKYGAKEGTVVVLDPKTGGVLAMASFPNYDPSHYQQFDEAVYKNPAVASSYEPGSTFKPLIMAAAINENLLHADTTFNESGPVKIGEYSIQTWNNEYHGTMTMTDILRYSSNVGMVYVSRQLQEERMKKYIKAYGIGEKTNVDLQEESSPYLRDEEDWREIDYATSSFGQGIAVTPLQITRAAAALANGGWLMEPHVVKAFKDQDGNVVNIKEKRIRQVISDKSAKQITAMMIQAVKYGEAKWAAPKGYKIAGKTGTAQIPVQGHYDETKTIASFVGFAPAEDPKFVMLVTLREPQSSQWGSETAAPLFFSIAKDLFAYLGIPPSSD